MLLLPFIWKKRFHVYFSLFSYSNARKSCALFLEFFLSHDRFLQGKILQHSPLPSAPPPKQNKIPLKTSVHFPITITICKHWSKFVTCSPSPRDCGGVNHSQIHCYYGFSTMLNKMAISKFWSVDFGKKMSVGGGLDALQFFWSLKKDTRTFHFR